MKNIHNRENDIQADTNKCKKIYIKVIIIIISLFIIFLITIFVTERIISNDHIVDVLDEKTEDSYRTTTTNNISVNIPNKEELVIGKYIPNNIYEIIATNYYPDIDDPISYTATNTKKIDEIVKLFANANWVEFKTQYNYHCMCNIKIEGDTETEFLMMGVPVVKVKGNNEEKIYKIKEDEYKEILDSVGIKYNVKYYLHKSNLNVPEKSKLLNLKKQILKGLTNEEILEIQDILRLTHVNVEYQLIESVSIIKDPESPYWEQANYGGEFTDPLTNVGTDHGNYCFNTDLKNLEKIRKIIKDEEAKKEFEDIIELLKNAMDNHDLEGCFKVHEFIHDYDYYAINYPAYFPTYPPPDWEGINVYFGHLKLN